MISSWLDLAEAVGLCTIGLHFLQSGEAWVQSHGAGRWRSDIWATLAAILGGMLLTMGLVLLLYSIAFALVSEGILRR